MNYKKYSQTAFSRTVLDSLKSSRYQSIRVNEGNILLKHTLYLRYQCSRFQSSTVLRKKNFYKKDEKHFRLYCTLYKKMKQNFFFYMFNFKNSIIVTIYLFIDQQLPNTKC